ncbi:unnamed protein product [Arctogadus glacialis]
MKEPQQDPVKSRKDKIQPFPATDGPDAKHTPLPPPRSTAVPTVEGAGREGSRYHSHAPHHSTPARERPWGKCSSVARSRLLKSHLNYNKKTIQGRQIIQPQLWFSWHLKTQNPGELSEPVMFQHGPTASKGSSGLYLVQPNPPTLSTADVQGKAPRETLREKEENLDDGAIKI